MTLPPTSYWLDPNDRIVRVSSTWDAFAQDNGGDAVVSAKVEGRLLWEFIQGDTTRMWMELALKMARKKGQPLERPYRCDSPTERRYMRMIIVPLDDGGLEIQHHALEVVPRKFPVHFDARPNALQTRCSLCARIHAQGRWVEAENIAQPNQTLTVVYTVCPSCQSRVRNRSRSQHPTLG